MQHLYSLCIMFGILVVTLGAYTRLKDAGLGCPDWPGCYGRALAPMTDAPITYLDSMESVDSYKAWIEMIHRYAAGILGLIVFSLTIVSYKNNTKNKHATLTASILIVIQALFGMWTVTLKLYPIIVSTHLFLGMALITILWVNKLLLQPAYSEANIFYRPPALNLKIIAIVATIFLLLQIFLGAWTSSNYAALVCADFPTCQGRLWPNTAWLEAFNLPKVGFDMSPGIPLENTARVTIQFAHRVGALVTFTLITITCYLLVRKSKITYKLGILTMLLLLLQVSLGITNILAGLPIWSALAHNSCALLLLLSMATIIFQVVYRKI